MSTSSTSPISLPPDLAERIQKKVDAANYRSSDEVIRAALNALDLKEQQEQQGHHQNGQSGEIQPGPIWKRFQDASQSIPESELDTLPSDGASQHDHYIYGTPKRSA